MQSPGDSVVASAMLSAIAANCGGGQLSVAAYGGSSAPSPKNILPHLIRWTTEDAQPFAAASTPAFREVRFFSPSLSLSLSLSLPP